MDSRRYGQSEYLRRTKNVGIHCILSDLKKVVAASNKRKKYFHIIDELVQIGLIEVSDDLRDAIFADDKQKGKKLIDEIEICKSLNPNLKVVYVQPRKHKDDNEDDFCYIYFDEFARSVRGQGSIGNLLGHYLEKWMTDAGECPPVCE